MNAEEIKREIDKIEEDSYAAGIREGRRMEKAHLTRANERLNLELAELKGAHAHCVNLNDELVEALTSMTNLVDCDSRGSNFDVQARECVEETFALLERAKG